MKNLKLKAEDTEDIIILSAYLQDAITKMADIAFQNQGRRFVMMLNRYVWENRCPETGEILPDPDLDAEQNQRMACSRVRTGLHFNDVLKISSQNIVTSLKEQPMELLSIEAYTNKNSTHIIDFIFAGEGVIRLECETVTAYMQDIGEPWPAKCHPKHEILDVLQQENS